MINIIIFNYIIIVFMLIIAIYSLVSLGIFLKIKSNEWCSKFIVLIKNIKLIYKELRTLIIKSFKTKKINVKKFKIKLSKLQLELLEHPLSIIIMLNMAIFILFLFLPSILILEKNTQEIFVIIAFISFLIFSILFAIKRVETNKELVFLRMSYLYMALPVIAIFAVSLLIFLSATLKLGIFSIAMSVIFFVIYGLFIFYICHRDVKIKFLRLALSLPIYIAILFFSSFIFGAYYYSIFNDLEKISSTNSIVIIKTYTKLGFRFFYSYIDNEHYNKVTLCQYYFGKLLDIFMLGYIFNKLTEEEDSEEKITESKVTEKKISTNEGLVRKDLNHSTKIIKKIRDVNIRKMKKLEK